MLSDESLPIAQDAAGAIRHLKQAVQVHFGVNPDGLVTGLLSTAYAAMLHRCPGLTINDLQMAYLAEEVEKKPFTTLTLDELIGPVKRYHYQKSHVIRAFDEIALEYKEELETQRKAKEYKEECLNLFIKCHRSNKWTGDEFQAWSVWNRHSACRIDIRVGRLLWSVSETEMKQRNLALLEGLENLLPSSQEIIFAGKWADYVCSRGIELDVFTN